MNINPLSHLRSRTGGPPEMQASTIRMGKDGFDITFKKDGSSHVVPGYHLFMLKRSDDAFNVPGLFTRKFKGIPFSILYDFEEDREYIVTIGARRQVIESIFGGIEGLKFEYLTECLDEDIDARTLWKYVAFPLPEGAVNNFDTSENSLLTQSRMYYNPENLADVYHAMKNNHAKMLVSFIPASEAELESEKLFYEKEIKTGKRSGYMMKEKKVSRFILLSNVLASMFTTKPVHDLSKGAIYGQERFEELPVKIDTRREHIARTIVNMCNNARRTNDAVFKVTFVGYGENSDLLEMHFHSKFPCVKEPVSLTEELTYCIPQKGGDVMSGLFASNFIYFPKNYSEEDREKSLKSE